MTEKSTQDDHAVSTVGVTSPRATLKAMLKKKGITQRQLRTALAQQGVVLSGPTISRIVTGKRQWEAEELAAARKVFDLPSDGSQDQFVPMGQKISDIDGSEPSTTESDTRPLIRTHIRNHPVAAGITAGLVVLAAASIIVAMTSRSADNSSQSTSPRPVGNNDNASMSVPSSGCQQYEVAANDLALRDEYGSPLIELPRGTKVSVTNVRHPRGLPYWQVTTEDGQTNWVDHRYLKPRC
jgi:hypothetical protein